MLKRFVLLLLGFPVVALAQSKLLDWAMSANSGNEVSNVAGVIDGSSVEIEGIVIINGEVSIDGVKIPRGTKKYRSVKSGKKYLIEWGRDNNVSVSEQ